MSNLEIRARALQLRIDSIRATTASESGHPTTCLSSADIISVLFFHTMKFDLVHPEVDTNDRFILSKGHGVPVVYAAYKQLGVLSDDEFMQLRKFTSPLEGHPTPRFIYNEAATGSLGQGLAIGAGMALTTKASIYIVMGDGELAEGSIWEAAEFVSHYKLENVVGIVDVNRLGQTGQTLYGHDVEQFAQKFRAFGWHALVIDGHDVEQIISALSDRKPGIPTAIIAKTFKGYGVAALEDKNGFHGLPVKKDDLEKVIQSLHERFPQESAYLATVKSAARVLPLKKDFKHEPLKLDLETDPNKKNFVKGESLATRKAFGYALAALGRVNKEVFAVDADVKNSTFLEIFEKEFPSRLIQCFIAEQTMVGVAVGLQSRGKIPFAATFGAFFTRAHDQIRMASIGRNALRLCGSHCGVSIGQDGPSQMGLEDLAMMRAIPDSVVLYPSDGVSTYKLVELMAQYNAGISYIRTTRGATPNLYDLHEKFEIGGCKVLRHSDKDQACIVAAGITLHEALKAYEQLKQRGIFVSVIDAYSIKPLDVATIRKVASGRRIITVEDHYIEGGLGDAVASALAKTSLANEVTMLAVTKLSRSGRPEELMAYAEIDAKAIIALFDE